MNKNITILWGNPYSLISIFPVIKKLSLKYDISLFLFSIYPFDDTLKKLQENKDIKHFKVFNFKGPLSYFFNTIKLNNLKKTLNESSIIISGDDREIYIKYILYKLVNKNIPKVVYWTHTSYFLDNASICYDYINGANFIDIDLKKYIKNNNIPKPILFKDKLKFLFSNSPKKISKIYYILRSKSLNFCTSKFMSIINRVFFAKVKITEVDLLSNLGSGNMNGYFFLTPFEVDIWNKIVKKNNGYLTNHPHEFTKKKKNNSEKKIAILTLGTFLNYNLIEQKYLHEITNCAKYIREVYGINKIIIKSHPRDEGIWIKQVKTEIDKTGITCRIINKKTPIIKLAKKYSIFFGFISASIMDLISTDKSNKFYLLMNCSKANLQYPDLCFAANNQVLTYEDNKLTQSKFTNLNIKKRSFLDLVEDFIL
jgi:hypothetical protein